MVAIIIITISILFFYFMLKIGGLLDSKSEKPQQPSRPTPRYSSHTIRDTPKPKQQEIVVRNLNIPDDNENGTYVTKIAGITHHCDETDQGIFKGIIFNESNNPYNPDAMAIASAESNKIVGYIPNDELKKYNRWCNFNNCPCVGFIKSFTNEEGKYILYGRVTAIKPCNENFIKEQTVSGIVWIETSQNMKYTGSLEFNK